MAYNKHVDKALDLLWDATLPVASLCPVCAFWRGFLAGAVLATLVVCLL